MKRNTLIILVFIVAFLSFRAEAQTGCTQKFEIKNVKKGDDKGSFELKLESKDVFTGQLVEVGEKDQTVVQSFSGEGNLKQTFKDLKRSYYRVILEFKNETRFLCKKRILTIDLTDSPQS